MAKTTKYWIYIIENYQWKDGKIGKIGVTQNPERRAKEYKLDSLTILEEHTNSKVVSKREIELQKQYGFKVDNKEYWKVVRDQKKALTTEAQKKRVANTDYSKRTLSYLHTPEVIAKRVKSTDYKARKINYKDRDVKLKKSILQYDLEGNFVKQWDSAKDASELLNKHQAAITECCRNKRKSAYKFIWKYA